MNPIRQEKIYCETTFDVLNHKLLRHALISYYNDFLAEDDTDRIEKKTEFPNDLLDECLRIVMREQGSYEYFLDEYLKSMFARFNSRFSSRFDNRHYMAVLTTLDFLRSRLSSLPIHLTKLNKELLDILDYDSHNPDSVQVKRQELIKAGVPLLDEEGNEVVNYKKKINIDNKIINNEALERWNDFDIFSVTRDIDGDELYFLILSNGKLLKKRNGNLVHEKELLGFYFGINGTYFLIQGDNCVTDGLGTVLHDSEGAIITKIKKIMMFGQREIAQVSSINEQTYCIDLETKVPFMINGYRIKNINGPVSETYSLITENGMTPVKINTHGKIRTVKTINAPEEATRETVREVVLTVIKGGKH